MLKHVESIDTEPVPYKGLKRNPSRVQVELRARRLLAEVDHLVLHGGKDQEGLSQQAAERQLIVCLVRTSSSLQLEVQSLLTIEGASASRCLHSQSC